MNCEKMFKTMCAASLSTTSSIFINQNRDMRSQVITQPVVYLTSTIFALVGHELGITSAGKNND